MPMPFSPAGQSLGLAGMIPGMGGFGDATETEEEWPAHAECQSGCVEFVWFAVWWDRRDRTVVLMPSPTGKGGY